MTNQRGSVDVRFEDGRLVVAREDDEGGVYYRLGPGEGDTAVSLGWAEAVHARIRPVGTAEAVLREWAAGPVQAGVAEWADPTVVPPVRVRAGAIVIRDGRMLTLGFEAMTAFEIPGGGVEPGETVREAVVRELWEESGLRGTVVQEVARVWKEGRREHYFLVEAKGEIGAPETLDIDDCVPIWIPVGELPDTPLWPRRLSWRIAHWYASGWPAVPVELADEILDLWAPCTW